MEAARIAFNRAEADDELLPFRRETDWTMAKSNDALKRRLVVPPAPGMNTVLVVHIFNIQGALGITLREGEAIAQPFARHGEPSSRGHGAPIVARSRFENSTNSRIVVILVLAETTSGRCPAWTPDPYVKSMSGSYNIVASACVNAHNT